MSSAPPPDGTAPRSDGAASGEPAAPPATEPRDFEPIEPDDLCDIAVIPQGPDSR